MKPVTSTTLHTILGAADALGLHESTVRKLIASGELKAKKVGARNRIPQSELERYTNAVPVAVAAAK